MGVLSYLPVSTLRLWHEILKFVSAFLNLKMSKFIKCFSSSNTLLTDSMFSIYWNYLFQNAYSGCKRLTLSAKILI